MHLKNGDPPCRWLETPTAVAVRLNQGGGPELLAPLGTRDLLGLTVRPTPHARKHKHRLAAYRARLESKNWPAKWPRLRVDWG